MDTPHALIVGGSRGIGLALTAEFLVHRWRVTVLTRSTSAPALNELSQRNPGQIRVRYSDVTDEASLATVARDFSTEQAEIDVLVNNAGILVSRETPGITQYPLTMIEETYNTNTLGAIRVAHAFVPLLKRTDASTRPPLDGQSPTARLVHISSIMGSLTRVDAPRNYAYSMSKAALNMFSRLLHQELRPQGIGVFSLHPGWVQTAMGGSQAPFTPKESASGLFERITAWRFGDAEFASFQGDPLPW